LVSFTSVIINTNARQSNATITGIYVMPNFSPKISKILKAYISDLIKNAKKIMSHARTSSARRGIIFNEKVAVSGKIVKTIVGYTRSRKSDIIIMNSRGEAVHIKNLSVV
jgi:hypothetical protein